MSKKVLVFIAISLLIVAIIGFFYWLKIGKNDNTYYFPPEPTQQERNDAKFLPKDKCSCWDGINNICLPMTSCI